MNEERIYILSWIKYLLLFILVYLPVHTPLMQILVYKLGFSFYTPLVKDFLVVSLISLVAFFNVTFYFSHQNRLNLVKIIKYNSCFLALLVISIVSGFINKLSLFVYLVGFRYELLSMLLLIQISLLVSNLTNTNSYILNQKLQQIQKYLTKKTFVFYSGYLIFLAILQFFGYEYLLILFGYTKENISNVTPLICHSVDSNLPSCNFTGFFSTPYHLAGFLLPFFSLSIYYLFRKINFIFSKNNTFNNSSISNLIPKLNSEWFINFVWILLVINISFNFIIRTNNRFALYGIANIFIICLILYLIFKQHNILQKINVRIFNYISKSIVILFVVLPFVLGIFYNNQINHFVISLNLPKYISKPTVTMNLVNKNKNYYNIVLAHPDRLLFGYGFCSTGVCSKDFYVNNQNNNQFYKVNQSYIKDKNLDPKNFLITDNWYLQALFNNGLLYLILYVIAVFYLPIKNIIRFVKKTFNQDDHFINNEDLIFNIFLSISILGILYGNLFQNVFDGNVIFVLFALLPIFFRKVA